MRRLALTLAAAVGLVACANGGIARMTGASKKKSVNQTDGSDPAATATGTDTNQVTKDIDVSSAALQVKNLQLLESSLLQCMGPNMTTITAEMMLPADASATPPALADGKFAFLLPNQYTVGDDILEAEKANLVDLENGIRTSTTGDGLTDTYLRSLETVANVVAHNCTTDNPNCQCATPDLATAMMQRCMPALDPETKEMQTTIQLISAVCAGSNASPAAGMREAVASILSSYAFAAAR